METQAQKLQVGDSILEGRENNPTHYTVQEVSQQGHEVHVVVKKRGEKGKLNWCYMAEALVRIP